VKYFLLVVVSVLILGCGDQSQRPSGPSAEAPGPVRGEKKENKGEKKVILAIFGAEWCHYCHAYLPAIQKELEGMEKATRESIDFRLYVPTGTDSGTVANDRDTLQFQKSLKLWATPYSDIKWGMYRYWISNSPSLPACAVVEIDGKKAIERFVGSDVSFCAATAAKEAKR
jgi:thiol-disulfide isomerase/thioredoxin